jgi:hypothetical protein
MTRLEACEILCGLLVYSYRILARVYFFQIVIYPHCKVFAKVQRLRKYTVLFIFSLSRQPTELFVLFIWGEHFICLSTYKCNRPISKVTTKVYSDLHLCSWFDNRCIFTFLSFYLFCCRFDECKNAGHQQALCIRTLFAARSTESNEPAHCHNGNYVIASLRYKVFTSHSV